MVAPHTDPAVCVSCSSHRVGCRCCACWPAGFGVVKFNKKTREITIECWPRNVDITDLSSKQYSGWPRTIKQQDNYGRKAAAYLPIIKVNDITDPVVQVIDEASGVIVYTLRIRGTTFRPKVFKAGMYTIKGGEPGTENMKTLKNLQSIEPDKSQVIKVRF